MNLEAALRDLAAASAAGEGARTRDHRLRLARQVVADRCLEALGIEPAGQPSIASVIRLAVEVPACMLWRCGAWSGGDACALVEGALRDVLLRCGYPFSGSIDEKMRVLERLHTSIAELMQPLEPTFPNWQGLYAG
jgi:hypothetical protein